MVDLVACARSLVAPGKGLLGADESVSATTKRLAEYGIKASEEMRRKYRDLFLGADGIEDYLSGVTLSEEALGQKGGDRMRFPNSLMKRGIVPGVTVDGGTEPFPESPDELITNGLIGLTERLQEYKKQGALFTRWRAVFAIDGDRLPTSQAIHENVKRLANYAKEAQLVGLTPICELEILYDGTHGRMRCREVLEEALGTFFTVLREYSIEPAGLILKTAMTLSGRDYPKRDTPEEVAEDTVSALMNIVPKQLAGVVFLCGGQTPDQATANLAAITKRAKEAGAPWPLTFSFTRALEDEALSIWKGKDENAPDARVAFLKRLKKVSAAIA